MKNKFNIVASQECGGCRRHALRNARNCAAVLLLLATGLAALVPTGSILSATIGRSLPVGDFASTSSAKAGFARQGQFWSLHYAYQISGFGMGISVQSHKNPIDTDAMRTQTGGTFDQVESGPWKLTAVYFDLFGNVPLAKKRPVWLGLGCHFGLGGATYPQQTFTNLLVGQVRVSEGSAPALLAGLMADLNVGLTGRLSAKLRLGYQSTNPKFIGLLITAPDGSQTTVDGKQSFRQASLSAGLAWAFRK